MKASMKCLDSAASEEHPGSRFQTSETLFTLCSKVRCCCLQGLTASLHVPRTDLTQGSSDIGLFTSSPFVLSSFTSQRMSGLSLNPAVRAAPFATLYAPLFATG